MMTVRFFVASAFAGLSSFVALTGRAGERQPLWPEGRAPDFQGHQIAAMTDEIETNAAWRTTHRMPYIEWCAVPTNANGSCMLLVSGGAYGCCSNVELVERWRSELTKRGFQCVNLVYRTPRPEGLPIWQSAWQDGQRAVRLVRSAAKARGFNPERIGAIGMSAGGHLVCLLATSALTPAYAAVDAADRLPCHINWAIAHAPAYNTANGAAGGRTAEDGVTISPAINPCFKFDEKTCPICFLHGGMDPYTPNGSTLCYRELRKRKVPAELHLYADKAHGAWGFERAVEFLHQMKFDRGDLAYGDSQNHRFPPNGTIRTEKELLWPEGRMPDVSENQAYKPYLVWFVPEKSTTKAIQVIVPGGGYDMCNFIDEGVPVATYLNAKGMTAVVVMYRTPRPLGKVKHQTAWEDAQRAVRMVRHEAPKRGLDPGRIGIMGFSAGGHLALMTATNAKTSAYEPVDEIDREPCNLQWACPVYPAYALTDGVDGGNTTGGNDDSAVLVPELSFDELTPPMCFFHGDADGWAAMNSVKCWEKLRTMGRQSDLHTFATRGHCFQFNGQPGTGSFTWMDQFWDFLLRKGYVL